MDGHATGDDRTLRSIAATLFALAVLAEHVGGRSYPVRCLMLFILRPAEAFAREFVTEAMQTPGPAFVRIPSILNSPADAIGLAMRLRALAALLRQTHRFARSDARSDRSARRYGPRPGRLPITPGDGTPRPNDTS